MKKKIGAFLLTIAYALILGHNIIPHHHHDSKHDLAEKQQLNQEHDGNHKDGLNHLLAHFIHSGDGIIYTANQNIGNSPSQFDLTSTLLTDNFCPTRFSVPPLLFSPPEQQVIYISPHSLASGLRAPPFILA